MTGHALFSPSASSRWIPCPGSMGFPENLKSNDSNTFADNGTASHEWSAHALINGCDAEVYLGAVIALNEVAYVMDEERAAFVQVYLDDVRRRAIGGMLFVEHYVDISHILGEGQGGTADAMIFQPAAKNLIVEDLKYGTGEKIFAQADGEINPQLGLYLLGALADAEMLGYEVETVTGIICQPRLYHIDGYTITVAELRAFGAKAAASVAMAGNAMIVAPDSLTMAGYLHPGEKQCRWCRAKTRCPAIARFVADEVRCDFETIEAGAAPMPPVDTAGVAKAYLAIGLIQSWCNAVRARMHELVQANVEVIGPDDKPYKFVEGKEGARKWENDEVAEAALLGQLGPDKAYAPRKILTAPAAAKLLDKKATKQLWADGFAPLIVKAKGQPFLVQGSDPRPPFSGAAGADEFTDNISGEDS